VNKKDERKEGNRRKERREGGKKGVSGSCWTDAETEEKGVKGIKRKEGKEGGSYRWLGRTPSWID
jgi:hypothetical protein